MSVNSRSTGGSERPRKGAVATPPASARQQRVERRKAARDRDLRAASTHRGGSSIGIVTGIAVVAAIVVIGVAWWVTQTPAPSSLVAPATLSAAVAPSNGTTLGRADAPMTLEIYSDFQCPYCGDYARHYLGSTVKRFVETGQLKIVSHDLPWIDDGGANGTESLQAANAALCGADQGKYWTMHDWLFANQLPERPGGSGAFTQQRLLDIGRQAALDMTRYQQCVEAGTHNAAASAEKLPANAEGTPSFVLNGALITDVGYKGIEAKIEAAAASRQPSGSATKAP